MAKLKGPLLSLEARGSLGKVLTYQQRKSGQQVRKYNKPLVAPSAAQRGQRRLTEFLVADWQNKSDAAKATWATNAKASGLNLSGYHYFLREAQRDLQTHHGLYLYLHCNEIVGGKVLDLSGLGNHGTLGPTFPSNAPVLGASFSTRFSRCLQFIGGNDWVEIANENNLDVLLATKFSIECWIINSVGTWQAMLSKMLGGAPYTGWEFGFRDTGELFGIINKTWSTDTIMVHGKTDATDGKLHQVVMTYDGSGNASGVKLYRDAVNDTAAVADHDTLLNDPSNAESAKVGTRCKTSQWLQHLIDEICFYKRELSAAEILTRYNMALGKI